MLLLLFASNGEASLGGGGRENAGADDDADDDDVPDEKGDVCAEDASVHGDGPEGERCTRAGRSAGKWAMNLAAASLFAPALLAVLGADGRATGRAGDCNESWLSGPLGVRDGVGGESASPAARREAMPKLGTESFGRGAGVRGKCPAPTRCGCPPVMPPL